MSTQPQQKPPFIARLLALPTQDSMRTQLYETMLAHGYAPVEAERFISGLTDDEVVRLIRSYIGHGAENFVGAFNELIREKRETAAAYFAEHPEELEADFADPESYFERLRAAGDGRGWRLGGRHG